ncbi:hypothetical protein CkaCkLH20_07280 [Colletotrichum karsti]|uniref:HNH nuclease domain-containing protein n=1 Tax=Colletotrichum karsti TaxID=1095194 RepID=A0A9P6LJZ3_9PEZI|nr:uncharacterized protein CkaCkLH20_07280 [Colletotrichum karsti]KAF9875460.1 hypothetical protein CkaCkLH20_07280 [Colletotrichum karsti]
MQTSAQTSLASEMVVHDFLHDKTFPLAERLKLIREIHHAIGTKLSNSLDEWLTLCDFHRKMLRSARCWALLLVWNRPGLEKFHAELMDEVTKEDAGTPMPLKLLITSLFAVPDLIWSFVAERPEGENVDAARDTQETRVGVAASPSLPQKLHAQARGRENDVCFLTGKSACDASYVIPPRASNEEAVPWYCLFRLTSQFGDEASIRRLMGKLEPNGGLTGTAANVITLSGPLKRMWERGRFALEPVGYETRMKPSEDAATRSLAYQEAALRQTTSTRDPPAASVTWMRDLVTRAMQSTTKDHDQDAKKEATQIGIKLRFHWLRKTNLEGLDDDPPNLDSDPRLLFQEWEDNGDNPPAMRVHGSGDSFTIWADNIDDLPDWDFLQLRWFAMRLYCLTGAADPDLYIPRNNDMLRDRLDAAMERANKKIDERRLAEDGGVSLVSTWRSLTPTRVLQDMGNRTDFLDEEGLLLEDRLEIIDEIRQEMANHPPINMYYDREESYRSLRSWAVLLTWEGRGLRAFRDALNGADEKRRNRRCDEFFRVLGGLTDMVYLFVKNPNDPAELDISHEKTSGTLTQNRGRSVCPFTGKADAEACHIIPTNANKPGSYSMGHKLRRKNNIIDTPANMLLLSTQLHRMWQEGKFALEPLGYEERQKPHSAAAAHSSIVQPTIPVASKPVASQNSSDRYADAEMEEHKAKKRRLMEPEAERKERKEQKKMEFGIKVRFHWLSKTECQSLFDRYPEPEKASNPRSMFVKRDPADAVPVKDGQIVTIWADDESLLPDWHLLILQWHVLRLHCLSGRADLDLYIPERDQDEDEDLATRALAAKKRVEDRIAEDEARALAKQQRELYALQLA